MKNLWNDQNAAALGDDLLAQRVYTSQLLGQDPKLVLHGGGNTSVKIREKTFFGEEEDILYVKGSGWDLETIAKEGFAPIRMDVLMKLAALEMLSDADMVAQMRAGMTNPAAPTGSVEAILHAALPFAFVDHTHANAILALTNNDHGEARVKEVYGDRVIVVPYIMPGFVLARKVYELIQSQDFSKIEGMVLMSHGIFSFANTAKESYDRMISLVAEAEAFISSKCAGYEFPKAEPADLNLVKLAQLRSEVSKTAKQAMIARFDGSSEAAGFAQLDKVADIAGRGPVTPDHVIRTKRVPLIFSNDDLDGAVDGYTGTYTNYFQRFSTPDIQMLDTAPRWAVWLENGTISFGRNVKDADIVGDIVKTTRETVQLGEQLGGWIPLTESPLFDIEYWELEQAKLKKAPARKPLEGKVALITGAAAGIGRACLQALHDAGAAVVGVDLNPEIEELQDDDRLGIVCNLTDDDATRGAVEATVKRFGGLDILVSNAGIFTAGAYVEKLDPANWDKSIAVNLTSHVRLLHHCVPYLRHGIDPTAIYIGSRNVNAPGAGAASYSCAKAGLTQLVRVAALELAAENIRVNVVHPDAVFDTKLWTPEVLARSAERYNMTVEEYKTRNLMKTEIKSADVGNMIATMAGTTFGKTTGAQIPVDGGNDRVI
ncbi:MAG: bifunctional aldolase/short-chain dehydrogenase [Verrucomicrobiaceae bacterium]|nr:bifunctional aldolase/short-chain dehydrogenase [Verrucomicrobiaceae bacterium]